MVLKRTWLAEHPVRHFSPANITDAMAVHRPTVRGLANLLPSDDEDDASDQETTSDIKGVDSSKSPKALNKTADEPTESVFHVAGPYAKSLVAKTRELTERIYESSVSNKAEKSVAESPSPNFARTRLSSQSSPLVPLASRAKLVQALFSDCSDENDNDEALDIGKRKRHSRSERKKCSNASGGGGDVVVLDESDDESSSKKQSPHARRRSSNRQDFDDSFLGSGDSFCEDSSILEPVYRIVVTRFGQAGGENVGDIEKGHATPVIATVRLSKGDTMQTVFDAVLGRSSFEVDDIPNGERNAQKSILMIGSGEDRRELAPDDTVESLGLTFLHVTYVELISVKCSLQQKASPSSNAFVLKFITGNRRETKAVECNPKETFSVILERYCHVVSQPQTELTFKFDDELLGFSGTPSSLGMESGDLIEVHRPVDTEEKSLDESSVDTKQQRTRQR